MLITMDRLLREYAESDYAAIRTIDGIVNLSCKVEW